MSEDRTPEDPLDGPVFDAPTPADEERIRVPWLDDFPDAPDSVRCELCFAEGAEFYATDCVWLCRDGVACRRRYEAVQEADRRAGPDPGFFDDDIPF